MRNLRLSLIGVFLALSPTGAAANERPDWVPEKYRKYIVRYVDERPIWRRALNNVDVELGKTGRSFALVAGVSFYPNMTGRERDLTPARVDVEKMASYLSFEPESFNEIVVLSEEAVTHDNLRYFLTHYFPRRLRDAPRSRFLFTYSGHGMTDEFDDGFLLLTDARNLNDSFHGISLNELRVWFQSVVRDGHQVLALINACYGSAFHKLSISFGKGDNAIPRREGAHAITAGGAGELTWHSKEFGEGSIFFEAVLKALDGRADKFTDGVVTIDELQTYLREKIRSFTDERQNPRPGDLISTGSPGGFFFLDRRRQVEKKVVAKLEGKWWQSFGGDQTNPEPWAGSWTSTTNAVPEGYLTYLAQGGQGVVGSYEGKHQGKSVTGRLWGQISGDQLSGKWINDTYGTHGTFVWNLESDNKWSGVIRRSNGEIIGPWNGTRNP